MRFDHSVFWGAPPRSPAMQMIYNFLTRHLLRVGKEKVIFVRAASDSCLVATIGLETNRYIFKFLAMRLNTIVWITAFALAVLSAPEQARAQKGGGGKNNKDKNRIETPQNPTDDDTDTQVVIENLLGEDDAEEFDFDTQFEYLEGYIKRPLDLNRAKEMQLADFGLLSSMQVQALLYYRLRFGQIYSIYELQAVPTFDAGTVRRIAPYVTLASEKEREPFRLGKFFAESRHQVFLRYIQLMEKQQGFRRPDSLNGFQGSPDRWYFRYRLTYRDRMSLGITLEKDAGERFFTNFSQDSKFRFFDYFSLHFYLRDLGKHCTAVALGDYQVFFGQGLTIWGGFRARKGVDVLNIKRLAPALRPYTSVNEALFMRGAAASFRFDRVETTVFASHRFRDANLRDVVIDSLPDDPDMVEFGTEATSLQLSGLHRNNSELADKNAMQQINAGANVRYTGENWYLGANLVYNYFNTRLNPGSALYQQFFFNGKGLLNASVDYAYNYKSLQLFGETAVSSNGGAATLNGMLLALDPRLQMALFQRYYSRNYRTFTGNALGEGSQINNEWGVYMGIRSQLTNKLLLNAYVDMFRFPWLRYQVDAPSMGYEYLVKLDYVFNSRMSAYAQYRWEEKGANLSNNSGNIDYLIADRRQNLRLHFNCRVSDEIELRSRVEFSFFRDADKSRGFMIYQDFIYRPSKIPLTAQIRLAFFDTDDYDTRIYAYENDVLYSFSVPALYGKGLRYYFNLNYKINSMLTVWLRFSQTYFTDREVISSGLNAIQGRTRSEIKAQVLAKF